MKKKLLSVLLSITVVAAMAVTGCGSSGEDDSSSSVDGGRTIHVMSLYNEHTEMGEIIRVLTDQYLSENPDASVEIEYVSQEDHIQKLSVLAASNDLPDLFIEGDASQAYTFYSQGLLKNVDEFIAETGVDYLAENVHDGLLNLQISNEALYTLPTFQAIEGWWYNTEIFDEYNLEPPTTMDEFIEVCDTLLENGVQPIAVGGKAQWPVTRLIGNYITSKLGVDALPQANHGELSWESPEFIEAYQWLADMNAAGYFGQGAVSADLDTEYQLFLSGRAAMVYDGSWLSSQLSSEENTIGTNVGFFGWPQVEGGVGNPQNNCQNYGVSWLISAKNYDEALADYLTYVFSRYGDTAMELQQAISGFKINEEHELDAFTSLVYEVMESADTASVWPEYQMPSEGMTVFMDNSQLLMTGDMSPEEFGSQIQAVMDSYN